MQRFSSYLLLTVLLLAHNAAFAQRTKKDKKAVEKTAPAKVQNPQFDIFFFNALKEKTLNNYDNALDIFNKCLAIDGNNDAVLFEIAKIHVARTQYNLAFPAIEKAVQLNPNQEWYLQLLAQMNEDTNNQKAAADAYKKLLELYPDRVEYFFKLANAYIFSGQYVEAIKIYDRLESQIGVTEDVSVQKQKVYIKTKKIDKAVEEADKLIDSNPAEVRYYMMAGEILMSNNLPDRALSYYEKALKLDPENTYIVLAMADYYRAKKDEATAYIYVKKAFALPQIDIDTKVGILYPFFSAINKPEYYAQALELCKIMLATHPNEAKAYAIYGDFLSQKEEGYRDAILQYKKAVKLDPSIYTLWDQLVRLQVAVKEYSAAIIDCDTALTLFPNQATLYLFGGIAQSQLGNHTKAVKILGDGLAVGSGNKALVVEMYSSLGDAYNELKEYQKSDSAYDKALAINPDQEYVLNNYSYYLSMRGENLEKAERMSKKTIEKDPKNASFLDTYAWILYKLSRFEEAKEYIQKAIEIGGGSATVMEHYGDILYKLGEATLALDNWKKAKEAGGKSEFLEKKIADKRLYE